MRRPRLPYNPGLPWLAGLVLFCLLGVAFLKVPLEAMRDSRDFAVIYLSSLSWRQGFDPYKTEFFKDSWVKAGGDAEAMPDWPSLYPICTFPLMAPFTLLKWSSARFLWTLINSLTFIALLLILLALAGYRLNSWRGIILFAVSLFYFPAQFAIAMGQPIVPAILFGVLSLQAAESKRWLYAGTLLGLSLALKVNLGILFLGYFIIYRKWPGLGFCLITLTLISLLGALRLGWHNLSWVSSWLENYRMVTQEWATSQAELHYPNSIFLLGLQYPLYKVIPNKFVVNMIAMGFGFIGLVILVKSSKLNTTPFGKLTMITAISSILLITTYHRLADATILILLILLISRMMKTPYSGYSKILTALIIPVYLPGPKNLMNLAHSGFIPRVVTTSWWWNTVLLPYPVYCLLFISVVMLFLVVIDKERHPLSLAPE